MYFQDEMNRTTAPNAGHAVSGCGSFALAWRWVLEPGRQAVGDVVREVDHDLTGNLNPLNVYLRKVKKVGL